MSIEELREIINVAADAVIHGANARWHAVIQLSGENARVQTFTTCDELVAALSAFCGTSTIVLPFYGVRVPIVQVGNGLAIRHGDQLLPIVPTTDALQELPDGVMRVRSRSLADIATANMQEAAEAAAATNTDDADDIDDSSDAVPVV